MTLSRGSSKARRSRARRGGTSTYTISYIGGDGNDVVLTALNDPPVVINDTSAVTETGGNGTAGTGPTGNVLSNDTDPDNGETSWRLGVQHKGGLGHGRRWA